MNGWYRLRDAVAGWARRGGDDPERGDVPGWVLVTLMTAGLVAVLWFVAEDALRTLFDDAISGVQPRGD